MRPEEAKLTRKGLDEKLLDYNDGTDHGLDQYEGARDFLRSIKDYVYQKARELADLRDRAGMMEFMEDPTGTDYEDADDGVDGTFRISAHNTYTN